MSQFHPRAVEPRAVRLCLLGTGVTAMAAGLPWQQWWSMVSPCWGAPRLTTWLGLLQAGLALAILLGVAFPPVGARALLRRARQRALLATTAAILWIAPLPFGPSSAGAPLGRLDWAWFHQAGAVGAAAAAIGAVWWLLALGRALCQRPWRRAMQRRAMQRRSQLGRATPGRATQGRGAGRPGSRRAAIPGA